MASIGLLWTTPDFIYGKFIRAVAAFGGHSVDLPESYVHFQDNRKPEYLAKFVAGKIPALETKEGFHLFETVPIARYVASLAPNSGLLGHSPQDQALVDQWVHYVESEVVAKLMNLVALLKGRMQPYSKPLQQFWTEPLFKSLEVLDKYLLTRTFFVGERITLADIFTGFVINEAVKTILDASERPKYPNLMRHYETIANQSLFRPILGETTYIEKAIQYVPPAKEPKKESKPAAAAAPKAEKKPKKEEAADEEDEPSVPAEPKVKNPLDDLPKSTFNLEDWKRAYSNKDTRGPDGSLEWFYQNYDPAGFSIWRVDFKYNTELTLTFMSSNQIGGFFNRLEASRKYLFGSMGVLGENNNSVISGVLIMRGSDVKGVVDAAPDWESYEYKKLDPQGNEEDKKFFESALAWDLELDGKKWADGKNFK